MRDRPQTARVTCISIGSCELSVAMDVSNIVSDSCWLIKIDASTYLKEHAVLVV